MNILLAGGAGYIGSHTAVELLNAGHNVVIVDDYSNSCSVVIERIEQITGKKVITYEADVKDKAAMRKVFGENKLECVIHFAGLKAVGESVQQPVHYYRNNIDTTLTLLVGMYAGSRCEVYRIFIFGNCIWRRKQNSLRRNYEAWQLQQSLRLDKIDDGRNP